MERAQIGKNPCRNGVKIEVKNKWISSTVGVKNILTKI